jgi:hypothetical protein
MARSTTDPANAASDWLLFDAFAQAERLTPSDIVNLAHADLLPRITRVDGVPFVHEPTLFDWRGLLHVQGFKPAAMRVAEDAAAE